MSIYVHVPFASQASENAKFDEYAAALVQAKNKYWQRYTLIPRGPDPLARVRDGDRLYVLIHGQSGGMRAVYYDDAGVRQTLTGAALAATLRGIGLRDRRIDLRLFSCLSALEGRATDPATPGGRSSLILELAAALRAGGGYQKMSFTGYTKPVLIDEKAILVSRKKQVKVGEKPIYGTKEGFAGDHHIVGRESVYADTADYKETVEAVKTNGCGPCYITTATCLTLGLADDCADLTALRGFRDRVLVRSGEGRRAVADYYAVAPALVRGIQRRPDAPQMYRWLYDRHIHPAVLAIEGGRYELAFEGYKRMVAGLSVLVAG